MGAFGLDQKFSYVRDGRDPGAFGEGDWEPGHPVSSTDVYCGYVYGNKPSLHARDERDTAETLCEVFL